MHIRGNDDRKRRAYFMGYNTYAEDGSLKISEDVIATIAGTAAADVKGIAGLSLRPFSDIKGIMRHKPAGHAIRMEMHDGEAVLDISVNLYLGAHIPEVATELQTRVKDAVQTMTGISVSKVHVHVAGVVLTDEAPAVE
ncbi:Asp23/Gls24 family envelope stress response protein [Ethanoligenens harbinense]|nr:Asp23/Gls24 family envelope stress response protein [Ethanoligenens harbinense YUAN-3]AYF38527.1 Asp23/Gls24 family envelope stress response protein [Ethanoligenens harbinense]AYF41274.1 Asp23/Gls24 family envelope stress response protein [Ethanoligenens harbinense]QCN92106.1 Asp23/Gls24 family envelope stress response protein [Ethanoligenens harbinense]